MSYQNMINKDIAPDPLSLVSALCKGECKAVVSLQCCAVQCSAQYTVQRYGSRAQCSKGRT